MERAAGVQLNLPCGIYRKARPKSLRLLPMRYLAEVSAAAELDKIVLTPCFQWCRQQDSNP
jgi:hypothetical protein